MLETLEGSSDQQDYSAPLTNITSMNATFTIPFTSMVQGGDANNAAFFDWRWFRRDERT
jgi:hypothetical protein